MAYGYPYQPGGMPNYFNTNYMPPAPQMNMNPPAPPQNAQAQSTPGSNVTWIYVNGMAGAAGAQILQLYNGSTALPCAIATDTVAANGIITQHVETVVDLATCCAITPVISARISGVAGVINHVCASVVKLA